MNSNELQRPELKISVLLTGNELLSGDITDTNSTYLSKKLSLMGLAPFERITVPDDKPAIRDALERLSSVSDVVIINGGLGSTVDDLTAEVVAAAAGTVLEENKTALVHVVGRFGDAFLKKNPQYSSQVRKQAQLPKGSETIDNPVGIALGFKIRVNSALCYVTPGVPREMEAMFDQTILPDIQSQFELPRPIEQSRIYVTAVGESQVQYLIKKNLPPSIWDSVDLGFRAGSNVVEVKMSVLNRRDEALLRQIEKQVIDLFPTHVFRLGNSVSSEVVGLMSRDKKRLAVAESCTGGRIAARVTGVAGASQVFDCGIVSYSNDIKHSVLSVSQTTLERYGAVSARVAEEMVRGVISVAGADYGIAVTGIAGPSGGTEEKPVGTVFIAWGDKKRVENRELWINRDRNLFQDLVASTALDLFRRFIQDYPTDTPYYYDELSRQKLRRTAPEK